MAFFRQLKLLLWKNWLAVIRQPLWSVTLLVWPLIIFIIIAVARKSFPPLQRDTCFVRPRNLPSAGFFPFLQTLMCNTDGHCQNTSLVDQAASKSALPPSSDTRASLLLQGGDFLNYAFSKDSRNDPAALIQALKNLLGPVNQGRSYNASFMNAINTTFPGNQATMDQMLGSVNLLKSGVCKMALPMFNATSSPDPLSYAAVTFCESNNTVLEVSIQALNQILTDLLLTKPDEMTTVAGAAILVFDGLQNQNSLWESLLAVPQLFSAGSDENGLASAEALLTSIQGALNTIKTVIPDANASFSTVGPLLAGGLNLVQYVQNWPGKDATVSLGDIVTLQNDSLSEMIKLYLQEVKIPLDKAFGLTLDRDIVLMYLCDNSSKPLWLSTACSTGAVNMLLGWISPDMAAKQALLVWSKDVAPRDVAFVRELLGSLMGGGSPGGQGGSMPRARRSLDTQPQNIDEELFLEVGQVVLELIQMVPGQDLLLVQSLLRTGFESMKFASLALETVDEMMSNFLADADQLQTTFLALLKNQSEASLWTGHVVDSVVEIIQMIPEMMSPEPFNCEDILGPFEWLLDTKSITMELWRSAICQNGSAPQQALLTSWQPLVEKAQDVYGALLGQGDYNVTLPMVLSQWHELCNNFVKFAVLSDEVLIKLFGGYWTDWMPNNITDDVTATLQQSVPLFMVNLGENIEKTQLWPEVKNYFHMLYWILNFRPDVTTPPANCYINITSSTIDCDTGLEWPRFVQAMSEALMSSNQELLVNCLNGTVNLLQHVYGGVYEHLAGSYLQEMEGDVLSAYLMNLVQNLNGFVSTLPGQNVTDLDVMRPLIGNLFQSTGLTPLLSLLFSDGPLNVSDVFDVASKLGRLNQDIFTFNQTDPTMAELEQLMMQFFSSEGNLTMSLSYIMGHTLLTYSNYFTPDEVARLREAIQPFTNQTSAGLIEAILSAMEKLNNVIDSPNGDPTNVILGYLSQLRECVLSQFSLQQIQQVPLPNGQVGPAQVTDFHLIAMDFLNLLSPEGLQNLSQAGPDAAQKAIAQRFVAFLPPEVRQEAARFLRDFQALQSQMTQCAAGGNCSAGISETFILLEQTLDMMLSADGNVTMNLTVTNSILEGWQYEEVTSSFFSLLLSSNDTDCVQTFKQILHFIRSIVAAPSVTVSDVQNALWQANLTLEELNGIAALAGAANVSSLMINVMEMINVSQCYEQHQDPTTTAQCAMGLISGVGGFLSRLPALRDEPVILSLITTIVHNAVGDVVQVDFSSNPDLALAHTLNSTLANIKTNLQLNQLYTPEIMTEITVVEGLLQLVANTEPYNNLNNTMNPLYAHEEYLKIVEWYLKRLENITSASSASELLSPFYNLTQMQVMLQLAQADFTLFVSKQVESLINNLQYPLDEAGVIKIGLTTVAILRRQFEFIMGNLEVQNNLRLANHTLLDATELQVEQYLDLIEEWMKQPNVQLLLSSVLGWAIPDRNVSAYVTDLQRLQGTTATLLGDDQLAYLFFIGNITNSLSDALVVAKQPGGLQSDQFLEPLVEALQRVMQSLTSATGPLPPSVEQDLLEVVQNSLTLIVQPEESFASSCNISLQILKRAESIIQQTVPEVFAQYLLSGLKVAATYFESNSVANGSDSLNLILDEMKTIQSFLPSNCTAQAYFSVLINITHSILESGQGNSSLWGYFENASVENWPMMFDKTGQLFSMLWNLGTEGPDSNSTAPSLGDFALLAPVLEQLMTGKADQDTWQKLEELLRALLSTLEGAEQWESVPSAILLFEKSMGSLVNSLQAQNGMIQSLQMPVVTLMSEIAQSVNSSNFNFSEVSERMQLAIARTVQAAEQSNGTLECSGVLMAWEPVREAAQLSHSTMATWCNISLQPVFQTYAAVQTVYTHMNISDMGAGPLSVSAASAGILRIVQSFYQVNINNTLVTEQLIATFSSQLSQLRSQPLSPEAQLHWYQQLQEMQLQNRWSSFEMLSDELVNTAPFLEPYIEAIEQSLNHIMDNYHLIQNDSLCEDLFQEAAMIFLSSANITTDNIFPVMWESFSEASLTNITREAAQLLVDMNLFGNVPLLYQALEQFLASNFSSAIAQEASALFAWWSSTEASGLDLLTQAVLKVYDVLGPLLSAATRVSLDMPANVELFEGLAGNMSAILGQLVGTGDLTTPMGYYHSMFQQGMAASNHTTVSGARRRREAPLMLPRDPLDDFIDLFSIDYPAMFKAISVGATATDIMETAHVVLANPDLGVVVKGATRDMPWGLSAAREETIDAALGMLSFLTLPGAVQMSSMDLLTNAADMLPGGFPFSSVIKNISGTLANESQENLMIMQETIQTAAELLQINMTDPQFTEHLGNLGSKVCTLENTESVRLLMWALSIEPGQLCETFLPSLQIVVENMMMNTTLLSDTIFEAVIGDPKAYNVHSNWSSVLSQGLGLDTSDLSSFNIKLSSPGTVAVGDLLRNKTAFLLDVQQHMDFDQAALHLLMETMLPKENVEILSWLVNLRHCSSPEALKMKSTDAVILQTFCSLSFEQWYSFSLLIARHINMEKVIYRMVLSEELQSLAGVLLQMAEALTNMMDTLLPAVDQLQTFMLHIKDLNLVANPEFHQLVRGKRSTISSKATFVTLSRALCSKGILALLGISKLPITPESNSTFPDQRQREEMIERFKIPPNATPFCMNMYLDMVNTTGGAIAWAFLKPMLMGQILYTPNTPVTRDIMEKANATLQDFANLRKYSEDWIESSNYIISSAEILTHTLPMLQNSLGNSFVQNFIEMQTDINVDRMKETLSNFSNMTVMLENNKDVMNQITTLSSLMVNISSCIKFDRYRGYNSEDELNSRAQDLAKSRDLYASVIFKLPKASASTSLPPKVSYTIRMHMDNVMRTDRTREPYFYKDSHISARQTLRYNRGFVYLQENIDRAIIETQTGQRVTEPAVQLQPFPYPCHYRDEFLEAISFVFPIILMLAWVLFVADFVKKLVYERELRLHEYMKMMGVNPLSHFFAWFLECTAYLVLTVFFLTLVLKYGSILPNSDPFLLFLYLCDYALSILSFSYLISSLFDKTYIAGLSASLLYILFFFPFLMVVAVETKLTFSQKAALGLFSPTCFSYASQYVSRYESQGEGIQWSNSYTSPIAGDTSSFGWLCWLLLIDSILYFIIGAYIRMVFPGKYGLPAPWYFPFQASFWGDLCCCLKSNGRVAKGLLFTNIMQKNQPVFGEDDDKGKGQSTLSSLAGENFSDLPVGVSLYGLSKKYGDRVAIENLNVSFYEGHVTSLLGHNGAGKTTTMSLLTGLFAPSSGTIEVYGRDMQTNIDEVRKELGVCMQYDVLFDHMTTKEHLLLYGKLKAPHWSSRELHEQVRKILEETDMHAHRHKRVGNLSGGMKRKLSISIAFIGGSRLVVLDEPTTGVDPCSRRNIWDIVIQYKKHRTVIMSTHHLDEAEVLSDRIAFLERGGLKCCGSPFYLKDKLGQGYKLTLTKKTENSEQIDNAELKAFVQAHVPEARLKEALGGDLVYSLPSFTSSNAASYRSLLTALDTNLDALQLGGYGISDTTLEEVFLQLTHADEDGTEKSPLSISETISDNDSIDGFSSDSSGSHSGFGDKIKLTGPSTVRGVSLAWQQMAAIMVKRFHHSRRDWKGLISQILLPVLFMVIAMGMSSVKSDLQHYPELELSPALYSFSPSYSFFSDQNPNSTKLEDTMTSFPGIDNACLESNNPTCTESTNNWSSSGNSSKAFSVCKCTRQKQTCDEDSFQPPHKKIPSSQIVYNLSGINVENYLAATANDFIRNRYGGFAFGMPLPSDLQMDLTAVPKNRTLSKVWFNPEGHHTMPAYLNSLNNLILRSNLPADKDPHKYAISVSSHPYFGRADDEDSIIQGMLQIMVALCVLTGFSITTASFAIYEVNEHHSGSKQLQHISGISEPLYWAVNFFYDMIIYLIPVTLTIVVIAAFQVPAFTDRQNLGAVTLLLVLFGWSTFPWMYLLSGIFKDSEMAFISYVCINLFISVNTIMSTSILFFLGQISIHNQEFILGIFNGLSQAFLIFPQFNFGNGLMELARKNMAVQLLSGYGIDAYQNPFSMDGLGWMFISSFIQGLVFFTLRLLLNRFLKHKIRNLIWPTKTEPQVACVEEDEDVAAERLRVSTGAASADILQVNQLTKVYQHLKKKVHAVKKLSVGIPAGECFGLLGVNGAGKTTTFKMLTGDVSPTDGTAQIKDWDGRLVDIMECRNKGINIGYCPQVDALDNLLTGKEHLYFYARIRGISNKEIDGVVNYLLKRLELVYHRDIVTDSYSCGTRRKLSTALALVGHPQILLLDEPSSGMDPRTKRHLWKIISEEVKGKCAVVLTSHSMEECEALCSRLAIMVKGQFRCLGSLQHIKNRFGSGFTVKMYLANASCDAEAITCFMRDRFHSTYLKDQHSNMVEYHVPTAPGGVADIFDKLESNKNALQIKHFSVSQTTLDEVFINFAMGNIAMESVSLGGEGGHDGLDSIKAEEM
ncbi:abca12 [Pungitius sinensis]